MSLTEIKKINIFQMDKIPHQPKSRTERMIAKVKLVSLGIIMIDFATKQHQSILV